MITEYVEFFKSRQRIKTEMRAYTDDTREQLENLKQQVSEYSSIVTALETKFDQIKFTEPEPLKPTKKGNKNLVMSKISKFMQMKTDANSTITNSQMSLGDTNSDLREHLTNNSIKLDEKLPIINKLERRDS